MNEIPAAALFAPPAGFSVRILDLSGGAEGGPDGHVVEEIGGFASLMHANAFASRYVRDSVERCRTRGASPQQVLDAWFAFGEDAEVIDAAEAGWHSANEVRVFAEHPSGAEARDWRALDPRLIGDDEPDDDDAALDIPPDDVAPG